MSIKWNLVIIFLKQNIQTSWTVHASVAQTEGTHAVTLGNFPRELSRNFDATTVAKNINYYKKISCTFRNKIVRYCLLYHNCNLSITDSLIQPMIFYRTLII